MLRASILGIAAATLVAACTTPVTKVDVSPSAQQEVKYHRGSPILISAQTNRVGLMLPWQEVGNGDRLRLEIAVHNRVKKDIDFDPATIEACIVSGDACDSIQVIGYDRLAKEEADRRSWAAVSLGLQGLSNAANAYSAGQSTSFGSFSATGPAGSTYGSYSGTTYDAGAAQEAQVAGQQQLAEAYDAETETQRVMDAYLARILRKHTVTAGEDYGGFVMLTTPELEQGETSTLRLAIPFGGETHSFAVTLKRPE